MEKQIKGLRKLSTEEMEHIHGGSEDCFLALLALIEAVHEHVTNPSPLTTARVATSQYIVYYACGLI